MDGLHEQVMMPGVDNTLAGGGEMGRLMRELNWSATPVGPVDTWPQSLRTAVSICLASRFPIIIFWGPDLIQFYNDAYRPVLGTIKHPSSLGQHAQDCWPEVWDVIGPMLNDVLSNGASTWSENQLLLLERNGYPEECYFTFSYSPIRNETGDVGGVFCAVTETTGEVLGERRLKLLSALTSRSAEAKNTEDACRLTAEAIGSNAADLPFALIYLLDKDGKYAHLCGTAGLPAEIAASPQTVDLEDAFSPWPLVQVARTGEAEQVDGLVARFGTLSRAENPDFPPPNSALVLPVIRPGQESPYGLLVAGLNPWHQLNNNYRDFLELVAGQVATAVGKAGAYQEERERAEALAELDRAKTAFFSNVSHEFRTPLTLLLGPLEEILSGTEPLSTDQRERLEMVRRNGLRLLKLVNTLLNFARIEAGRAQAVYEPTDLATFTADLASAFRSAIERAGLRLVVECPQLSEPVYVDREMWEKIVLNLLSNAFKFTFEGEIGLTLRVVDDHVELVVRDTGTGIPAEELSRIFERFHRVLSARARTHEGSGIGLALVQELVRLHGGTIQVTSTIGKGTTFTVTLPRGSTHLPPDRIGAPHTLTSTVGGADLYVEEASRWLPEAPNETSEITPGWGHEQSAILAATSYPKDEVSSNHAAPSTAHILLVDDNADMRDYLKRLLSQYYTIEAVANGALALSIACERIPDLVLSDVMMPGLDGFELLRALRANPRTHSVPVILLSARAGEEASVEGLQAGANDYLMKPFSARELLARVKSRLEISQMYAQAVNQEREHSKQFQKLADENAQLYQQAQEAVRDRDNLLSMVSHDLKNPLTTIKGYTQLLQRMINRADIPEKDDVEAGLTRIEATVSRMTALINELLDLAQVHIGQSIELKRKPTDVVKLTRQVVEEQQETTQRHTIHLETEMAELIGHFDPLRLERVLANLISNAIKYDPAGKPITVRIACENSADSSYVILEVQDQGIGIPGRDLPYIFEQFHRAGNVVGSMRGTGIGLASVQRIVELHSGTITVTSQEGVGSTFTVRLPLQ